MQLIGRACDGALEKIWFEQGRPDAKRVLELELTRVRLNCISNIRFYTG